MLRFGEDVDTVDVGFEGPREEVQAVRGPEWRREHGDRSGDDDGASDAAGAGGGDSLGGGEPADESHEYHGETEDVEDIYAKEVGPGHPFVAEDVFLETEENAEGENFGTSEGGLFEDDVARNSLFAKTVGNERHGDASQENEERRGERAAELRPVVKGGIPQIGAKPGIVTVGLKHEETGEAAEPVDVREARGWGV